MPLYCTGENQSGIVFNSTCDDCIAKDLAKALPEFFSLAILSPVSMQRSTLAVRMA
ncbi:hypothetical protein ECC18A13_009110 [Enterobacter sp. 18A13]|nr:hypothetical protein ECC18A13_009110 [Enterobacter sp. 18A13]